MRVVSDPQVTGPIEIRPEVTMLSVLRHLNYKPWFAIAEFIDNSLQSYLANFDKLKEINGSDFRLSVDVRIDANVPGLISITDNAAGISAADFPRAFRAAQVPADRAGLSEFGMGMKSAACWFAERWSVRTKAIGESVERTIEFDIRNIVDNRVESLNVESRENGALTTHYTVVTLRGLHHVPQGRTLGKIKEHLASIYRVFLRSEQMMLRFNGEPLSYQTAPILKALEYKSPGVPAVNEGVAVEWRKNISLDFGKGQSVTGFAALRETGSTPYAGFALFRRNRLIEGSHDETYRPTVIFKQTNSYPYQRLFGELHLEGFDVSHTKDGFRWEEHEEVFLSLLKEELEAKPFNLLAQADNYRALPTKKSIESRANSATSSVVDYIKTEVAPLLVEAKLNSAELPSLPLTLPPSILQASERTVSINDGTWDWVITIRTSIDAAREDWIALSREGSLDGDLDETRRIVIDLALAHPFSSEFIGSNNENIELFLRVATAICISMLLAEDFTAQAPEVVLFHFNQLMRGALSRAKLSSGNDLN